MTRRRRLWTSGSGLGLGMWRARSYRQKYRKHNVCRPSDQMYSIAFTPSNFGKSFPLPLSLFPFLPPKFRLIFSFSSKTIRHFVCYIFSPFLPPPTTPQCQCFLIDPNFVFPPSQPSLTHLSRAVSSLFF
jgi:hypothetical protein